MSNLGTNLKPPVCAAPPVNLERAPTFLNTQPSSVRFPIGVACLLKGSLQASVAVRNCGVTTKYTEIRLDGNPLKFDFEPHMEGDTYQFTAAPLHNEAMAARIAGEYR